MPSDMDARDRRSLWFIWGAMLWSVVLYGVVGTFVRRSTAGLGQPAMVAHALAVVAIAIGLGSLLLRSLLARKTDYRSYAIVRWAMAEAVAILGLVFVTVGGLFSNFPAFLAVAAGLLILHRPSAADRDGYAARRGEELVG